MSTFRPTEDTAARTAAEIAEAHLRCRCTQTLLRHSVESGPSDLARAARMFWRLEVQTRPSMLREARINASDDAAFITSTELAFREAAIKRVFRLLADRAAQRWLGENVDSRGLRGIPARLIGYLSGVILSEVRGVYSQVDQIGARKSGVAEAFARFASGQLMVERRSAAGIAASATFTNAGPDGPSYVLFAEFALTAVRLEIDERLWLDLLPFLLSSQFLYQAAYGAPGRPLRMVQYIEAARRRPARVDETVIRASLEARPLCVEEAEAVMQEHLCLLFADPFRLSPDHMRR